MIVFRARRLRSRGLATLIGLAIALILSELVVRALGYRPWEDLTLDAGEPTMHEPDRVLGWRSKPGRYVVPPYQPGAPPIEMTFLERGTRRSASSPIVGAAGDLVMVGDSFTQGWAISDHETYAWKLQEKRKDLAVSNFGTAGYGTYQALLVLERELPRLPRPRLVLHGFLEQHEMRNAAAGPWLEKLSRFSRRGHVSEPFATLDTSGALVRHAPVSFPVLPLRRNSALVTLFGQAWMDLSTRSRVSRAREVTQRLLQEMKAVTEARGARLAVVLLQAGPAVRDHYRRVLRDHHIQAVDCVREPTSDLTVLGEGHPNGALNTLWAECIAAELWPQPCNAVRPGGQCMANKRETIQPKGDKRFIRRDEQGRIQESDDAGRSIAQDKKRSANTRGVPSGMGDKGERSR